MRISELTTRIKSALARRRVELSSDAADSSAQELSPKGSAGDSQVGRSRSGTEHSVRRINRIAAETGAQTYLEIGVARGYTFRNVRIPHKVGVDPRFRCDVAGFREAGSEMHEITSDEYFVRFAGARKFDVIYLDGLHQFQQTLRDFCNSLLCSHDATIWLVDDVVPSDVYSAWPIMHESIEFRRSSDGASRTVWHGDVFKLVFAIHDLFPMLSYTTVVGSGNPQLIVWKAPRVKFSPVFNSLEAIERLQYFDMLKRFDVFNGKREEEAISEVLLTWRSDAMCHRQIQGNRNAG